MPLPARGDSALLVLTPPRVNALVQPWRRAYLPEPEAIPPHITVTYPPFVPADAWSAVKPTLTRCLAGFHPFMVTLQELGAFPGDPAVLWLRPDERGQLSQIQAAIAASLPEFSAQLPWDFVPHLTLGFFKVPGALAEAQAAIAPAWQPMRFRVSRLAYAVLQSDGVWIKYDEVPLGVET